MKKYSISTIVFIVFLTMKLCGVLDWSWWWVTSPLWILVGVELIIIGLVMAFYPDELKKGIKEYMDKNSK